MEVTKLQVGDQTSEVKVIVSTVAEAEHLSDFLCTCRQSQRRVNVSTVNPYPKVSEVLTNHLRYCMGSPYLLLKPKGWRI